MQTTSLVNENSLLTIRPLMVARWVLLFTLLFLPLHTQVFYYMVPWVTGMPQAFISVWKEFAFLIVGLLIIVDFALNGREINVHISDLSAFLFLIYLFIMFFLAPDKSLAAYSVRAYAEPLLVYYLTRSVPLNYEVLERFFRYFLALAAIISFWSIIQAAWLGDDFLIGLGYDIRPNGLLPTSFYIAFFFFQRAVGTFVSPNTFGIFLQMAILLGIFLRSMGVYKHRAPYLIGILFLIFALLYSFSRSAWLATLVSVFLFMFMFSGWRKFLHNTIKIITILILFVIIAAMTQPSLVEPVVTHIKNTLTLEDPSAMGHIESLIDSIEIVANNPFGIGLGLSGPRAIALSDQAIHSENSFFILAFDVGLPGICLYAFFLLIVIMRLHVSSFKQEDYRVKTLMIVVVAIFWGQMVAWQLLPYMLEMEITLLLFAFLGIAQNVGKAQLTK